MLALQTFLRPIRDNNNRQFHRVHITRFVAPARLSKNALYRRRPRRPNCESGSSSAGETPALQTANMPLSCVLGQSPAFPPAQTLGTTKHAPPAGRPALQTFNQQIFQFEKIFSSFLCDALGVMRNFVVNPTELTHSRYRIFCTARRIPDESGITYRKSV